MKKFLYTAFAFCSLFVASCSESGGVTESGDYEFESAHLSFNFHIKGDIGSMVDVTASTTLPETDGKATSSSDGTKHTIFISNIKCPATFDVVYTLTPKSGIAIEENKKYTYSASYDYTLTRNFSDNSHIVGTSANSSETTGTVKGKDMEKFFELNRTSSFVFKLTHDGYIDETPDEDEE